MGRTAGFSRAVAILALLVFFALALKAAVSKSPTADEGMHLLRGTTLWQTGELSLQGQHAPLSHWLIGSFLSADPTTPNVTLLTSWSSQSPIELVQEFLWQSDANVGRILFLGRMPIILASLLFGSLLMAWSRCWSGPSGQNVVAVLFAFSPNLLASSALATTDLVAAATFVAALIAFWYFWQQPSLGRWLLAGCAVGMALGSKLSGIVVLPATFIVSYAYWLADRRARPWWWPGLLWISLLPLAGFVVLTIYRFEFGTTAYLPFPVPAPTYLDTILAVQRHIDLGHYAYLLGERSNEGWLHYFGIAFLVKTPGVTLVLLTVSIIYLTWRRKWRKNLLLWLPAALFFAAASYSRLNIGYRHILPILPFVWLLIAETATEWSRGRGLLVVSFAVLSIYAIGTLRQRPHFLAYFNEFVGGSRNGYRYLGDSNIDWGQDLPLLADYARKSEEEQLYVSYSGTGDRAYYGLDNPPLFDEDGNPLGFSPANPAPGRYAISVNHLLGANEAEPDLFDWFRRHEPVDQIGYSILIFEVPEANSGNWMAHCLDPEPAIDEATASDLVGQEGLRHLYFDCRSSWVIPAGGDPGWYVLPLDLDPQIIKEIFDERLELVYSNANSARAPAYNIYHWKSTTDSAEVLASRSLPVTLPDGTPVDQPIPAADVAWFIGGTVSHSVWATFWQAEAATERSISIFLHLYGSEAAPIVGDGLGYFPQQWQPGDVFVQYHDYAGHAGNYLETGIYDYSTGEGLPFYTGKGEQMAVRVHPPAE